MATNIPCGLLAAGTACFATVPDTASQAASDQYWQEPPSHSSIPTIGTHTIMHTMQSYEVTMHDHTDNHRLTILATF